MNPVHTLSLQASHTVINGNEAGTLIFSNKHSKKSTTHSGRKRGTPVKTTPTILTTSQKLSTGVDARDIALDIT